MNRIACESDLNNVFTQIYIDPFLLFFLGSLPSMGFPGGSDGKESVCNAGDLGSVPGLGRSPGAGHDNPFQYTCMDNSMDREARLPTVHWVAQSGTRLK